ncbi:MAG: SIMPL domain-containing protein [Pirellulaceae bacterium]
MMPSHDLDEIKIGVSEMQNLISIDGVAELRVRPSEIRMVLAAVSQGQTANECREKASARIAKIQSGWQAMGIAESDTFEDFISILPVYRYEEQQQNRITVLQEVLDHYRYQTNLHVKLADNSQAQQALNVAFESDVTDIISFDYWHPELNAARTEALQNALAAARQKADLILDAGLFPERPRLVNVRETHRTIFPSSKYQTFTNVIDQTVTLPYRYREDVPRISAPRPKTTFYGGLVLDGDSLSPDLPMKPEISVVSRVRLYFQAPFDFEDRDTDD